MALFKSIQRVNIPFQAVLVRRVIPLPVKLGNSYLMSTEAKVNEIIVAKPLEHVAHVQISNQKAKNALSLGGAKQLSNEFKKLEDDANVRCVILSGDGPDFTSGVELKNFSMAYQKLQSIEDPGRKAKSLLRIIKAYQEPFKVMSDNVSKPIICCIHGLCFGLGMELAACSDIRFAAKDATMSVREVLISIAADVGSLQKLPKLFSNQSLLREYIYSGNDIPAEVARELGFVGRVFDNKDKTIEAAMSLAESIASKSPIAVQGSKVNLRFSENKSFKDGLDYNAVWNMSMLQSEDVLKSVMAILSKGDKVKFDDY